MLLTQNYITMSVNNGLSEEMDEKDTIEIEKSELKAIEELGRAASDLIHELNREEVLYEGGDRDER